MANNSLFAKLSDPDERVRADAREELNLQMDDQVARVFLDVATGEADEQVRADTIIGLGPIIEMAGEDYGLDEPDFELDPDLGPGISRPTFELILRELRALYDDESQPTLVRRSALEALVRDPQPWQSVEVRKTFALDDPAWKRTAVFAMGYVSGFDKEIASALEATDESLLVEAIRAAGRSELASATDQIREIAMSNKLPTRLRIAAIEALPYVDDDCDELLSELTESRDGAIAEAADAALDEILSFDDLDLDDD